MVLDDTLKLLLGQVGTLVSLILALAFGAKRIWVWGYQLKEAQDREVEARKDAIEWRDRFLQAQAHAATAIDVAEKAVRRL